MCVCAVRRQTWPSSKPVFFDEKDVHNNDTAMDALRGEDTWLQKRNISIFKVFELEVPTFLALPPTTAEDDKTSADLVRSRDED